MSNTLSLKSKKQVINFSSLSGLIENLFSPVIDKKTDKMKPIKLLASHVNSLVDLPISTKMSINERESLSKIVLESDCELKTLLSLLVASEKARHPEVRKEVLEFTCHVINKITFLNPTSDTNIFLLKDISQTNSGYLARLVKVLQDRFEIYKGENYKPSQKRNLEANILAIAHIWAFETGKADIDTSLNSFTRLLATRVPDDIEKHVNLEMDKQATTGMVYFLASQTNSSLLKDFSSTISFFKARQEAAQSESTNLKRTNSDLQERHGKLLEKIESLKTDSLKKDNLIKQLSEEILSLKEQHSESEQSLKAQKVHLKDDTSKAKAKALNFLEEEVLSTLENSYKALDREAPKVHVALHNLDVMIERVEEELRWFKK
ncbi:TPA: hypothetical protein ACGSSZ_004491 [Vibrio parahaemolyticus]